MEYLITAKFRPDTYFLLGKEIVLDKEGQPIKIEDERGSLRNKTKADEANNLAFKNKDGNFKNDDKGRQPTTKKKTPIIRTVNAGDL